MAEISVPVVRNILQANERLAAENRRLFDEAGIFVVNLMSSPGAGKTSLLERTIEALTGRMSIAVIEGDLQSSYDAERIRKKGVQAVQINTDGGCLACGEPIGASGLRQIYENVMQLRGAAGAHQVPTDVRIAYSQVYGAPGLSAVCLLGRG